MKRCPECRRDYHDDSLIFCLDDGARLLEGPGQGNSPTAILPSAEISSESATRTFESGVSASGAPPTSSVALNPTKPVIVAAAMLVSVGLLAWAGFTYYGRGPASQIESIAVLPFVNAAGNPDIEYLSDGITESLINSLSQMPSLSVKARSSVFTYKGKEVSPQQVAKDLSVQAVVNGRVQQLADQVVINVELVEAGTGNQLWGDQYTRKITDLVKLQSEIARDVSNKLRNRLTRAEQQKVAKSFTENPEAYQLYLRGRYHWNKRMPDDIRRSIEYFQQALDKDPTYALSYAALAETYVLIPNYRLGAAPEYYPKARAAAMKAIEIDGSLAEAHNALASVIANYDWKFADAEAEFRKALELNPNYASGHQWYAEYLLSMGRYDEALAEIKRAQELDPLSLIINGMVAVVLRIIGRNQEALVQLQKTLEMDPNFARTHLFLAETYQEMGRYEDAADEFAKHFVLNGGPQSKADELTSKIKNAARAGGEKGYSRAMAEVFEAAPGRVPPPPPIIANYWIRAGDIDRGFELLEKAYASHDDSLFMLKDPKFAPIKNDPRYKDLLRRVGLPE
jgi:TolB-like protein/Tfp pilus assembly protein PilF